MTGVRVDDGRTTAVRLWNKGGSRWVRAGVVIDASGDADVCAMAGVFHDAPGDGGPVQSLSTLFKVANVDIDAASAVPKRAVAADGRGGGRAATAAARRGVVAPHPAHGCRARPHDPHPRRGPHGPGAADRGGGRGPTPGPRVPPVPRDRVPGFARSVIVATSPAIGVRESRRVHGDYRLTRDDVLSGRRFKDEIALCGAPIEDHGAGATRNGGTWARGACTGSRTGPAPAGSGGIAGGGTVLLGDARRARVGPVDGDVHGDGPGCGDRGRGRGGGRDGAAGGAGRCGPGAAGPRRGAVGPGGDRWWAGRRGVAGSSAGSSAGAGAAGAGAVVR